MLLLHSGVTGTFFWGAKSLFPFCSRRDFSLFPVKISIFVDPEKVSLVPKVKSKKKKKKEKENNFLIFILLFSIFPNISHFLPFFLASLFLISRQNFTVESLWRALYPPAPLCCVNFGCVFVCSSFSQIKITCLRTSTKNNKPTKVAIMWCDQGK